MLKMLQLTPATRTFSRWLSLVAHPQMGCLPLKAAQPESSNEFPEKWKIRSELLARSLAAGGLRSGAAWSELVLILLY